VLDGLRAELTALGLTPFDIELPGEEANVAPLEGALRLRRDGDAFVLETVDYGRGWRLGRAATEAEARRLVLDYVGRPLPPVKVLPRLELDRIVGALAPHYFDLRDRATAAGQDGVVIDLPPDLAVDRLGALDGVHLYPVDTPIEFRSLPPHALRPESDLHRFLTRAQLRVSAVITPPWFGRPGGGIRFTLQEPEVGIRDLVVAGRLERIQVVEPSG
jgi:hypothetical protein